MLYNIYKKRILLKLLVFFIMFLLLVYLNRTTAGQTPAVFRYAGEKGGTMAVIESTAEVIDIKDTAPKGKSRKCKTTEETAAYKTKRGESFSGNNGAKGRGRGTGKGNPRVFKSGDELIDAQIAYCKHIRDINYIEYPTKNGLAEYLQIDPKTIWLTIERYYPGIKRQWQENIEQTLINGVNAGVYNVTMTKYILANWCGWSDRRENVTTEGKPKIASKAELKEAITAYLQAPIEE